jgi:hypothetical protein
MRAFYEKLGFTPWFGGREPWDYEIVSRGHLVVHFFAKPRLTPTENDACCYWRVRDADRLYQEFAALHLPAEGIPRLTMAMEKNRLQTKLDCLSGFMKGSRLGAASRSLTLPSKPL